MVCESRRSIIRLTYRVLASLVIPLTLYGCQKMSAEHQYIHWVENPGNGLLTTQRVSNYNIKVQYQPDDYRYLLKSNTSVIDPLRLKENRDEAVGMQFYHLTFSLADPTQDVMKYGVASLDEYQQKIYYFSYRFQYDIELEHNGQKLDCKLFHFEDTMGLSSSRLFLLGFENPDTRVQQVSIIINSSWISKEPVELKLNKNNILLEI